MYDLLNNTGIGAAGTVSMSNAGVFEKTADSGLSSINAAFTNTSSGTINAAHGELQFDSGGSLAGVLSGAGEIDLNGGNFNLAAAATLSVATLAISGGDLILNGGKSYGGSFSETGGSTLALNGSNLTLSGSSNLDGATISGPGTLDLTGAATLGGVVLTGGAVLEDAGSIVQTGNPQLGDSGADAATLSVTAAGVYSVLSDSTIYSDGAATVANAGRFEKAAGAGTAVIDAGFGNTGTVVTNVGTLLFETVSNLAGGTLSAGTWEANAAPGGGTALALGGSSAISTDAANIILAGGGTEIYSGNANSATIESSLTSIAAGGTLQVLGGKDYVANGPLADAGQLIVNGGTFNAKLLTVAAGGAELVLTGGSAAGGLVTSGGSQTISAGGVASGAVVSNGGNQLVAAGGITSGTTVNGGGTETIYAGGEAIGTKIAGGTLDVTAGGLTAASISFTGSGGELIIESNVMPTTTISGFVAGDAVKLAAVPYSASDTVAVKQAGVVTVSAGGHAYALNIAGATVGETDFNLGAGSLLTKVTSPQMKFIAPRASVTPASGGVVMPSLAEVAGNPALNPIAAAAGPAAEFDVSAHQLVGGGYDMMTVHRGGAQMLITPHGDTSRLL